MKNDFLKKLPFECVYARMKSPVGELYIVASDKFLYAIYMDDPGISKNFKLAKNNPVIENTIQQLQEYFAGRRQKFDLPVRMLGTDFQVKAWKALQRIPYGQTRAYSEQAVHVGGAHKARAVGLANNRNPVSIVVPCHRVIGKNGHLVGYGGGLNTKKYLLELEQRK